LPRLGWVHGEIEAVWAMHPRAAMISKKSINKVLKGAIAAMPAIPYITKRRSSMLVPFVLGGIGVALMGGMAAVMFMSPRTRYRAIDMAKNTYGKLEPKITELVGKTGLMGNPTEEHVSNGLSNGLSNGIGSSYTSTGL